MKVRTRGPDQHPRIITRPGSVPGRGFTLIELVVVMVIVAVVAAAAIPALNRTESTRDAAAARLVAADLAFARPRAAATGHRVWVEFNPASNSWTVLQEDAASPGYANASTIVDPATGSAMVQRLDVLFAGAALTSADFDGSGVVGFDWLGRPLAAAETALAAEGRVVLNSGFEVRVRRGSGLVRVVSP